MYYISYSYENIDGVRFAVDGEIIKVGVEYIISDDAVVTLVNRAGIMLNHVHDYELYESEEAALTELNRVLKFNYDRVKSNYEKFKEMVVKLEEKLKGMENEYVVMYKTQIVNDFTYYYSYDVITKKDSTTWARAEAEKREDVFIDNYNVFKSEEAAQELAQNLVNASQEKVKKIEKEAQDFLRAYLYS
jgi:hypothetical protein